MKHLTIAKVAEIAGVSKTTMSRYLNGDFSHMSEATRKRIEDTVERLNFRPNRLAQTLKSRKSYLIGVMVDDISTIYASMLLKGLGSVFRDKNYHVLIMDSAGSPELEKNELYRLIDQRVDGIILQPVSRKSETYQFIEQNQIPLVLVDRQTDPLSWPTVLSDNFESTSRLAHYIIDRDYKRILVVSQPVHAISSREQRYHAIKAVTGTYQIDLELIEIVNDSIKPLSDRLKTLNKEKVKTALFFANSKLLSMALNYILFEAEMKIPEDIGVTGYDDWNWAALAGPGITCVEQNPQKIGEVAARTLLQKINSENPKVTNYIIPVDFKIRRSL